jgi:uncharacterized protein YacL
MMNYQMGDEIVVKIDRDGLGLDEGIGHLSDETMVVIYGAGQRVGQDVQAIITGQVDTRAGSSYLAYAKA